MSRYCCYLWSKSFCSSSSWNCNSMPMKSKIGCMIIFLWINEMLQQCNDNIIETNSSNHTESDNNILRINNPTCKPWIPSLNYQHMNCELPHLVRLLLFICSGPVLSCQGVSDSYTTSPFLRCHCPKEYRNSHIWHYLKVFSLLFSHAVSRR